MEPFLFCMYLAVWTGFVFSVLPLFIHVCIFQFLLTLFKCACVARERMVARLEDHKVCLTVNEVFWTNLEKHSEDYLPSNLCNYIFAYFIPCAVNSDVSCIFCDLDISVFHIYLFMYMRLNIIPFVSWPGQVGFSPPRQLIIVCSYYM